MNNKNYNHLLKRDGIVHMNSCITNRQFHDVEETILNLFVRYGGNIFKKYINIKKPLENQNFHHDVINFRKRDKKNFGIVYDVMQNTVSINRFFTSKSLISKLSQNLNLSLSNLIVYPTMMRIDVPSDERNILDWHQDNLIEEINQSYEQSITLWIPLSKVDDNNGSIEFCLKSHKKKIL